ncbi:MAG: hypothetical protein PVJ86_07070 [Phycisphaerales bacterium]|jgi:hypothetical protein
MTVESITNRVTEYFSWPYYGQWEGWILLGIAMMALVVLILAGRAQARSTD